jgi:hypothetical protein
VGSLVAYIADFHHADICRDYLVATTAKFQSLVQGAETMMN